MKTADLAADELRKITERNYIQVQSRNNLSIIHQLHLSSAFRSASTTKCKNNPAPAFFILPYIFNINVSQSRQKAQ